MSEKALDKGVSFRGGRSPTWESPAVIHRSAQQEQALYREIAPQAFPSVTTSHGIIV